MTFTQVGAGIYRVSHGISNFYIIDRGGHLALVDAGVPKDWSQLTAVLRSLGRAPGDITAIVLTHAHSDHTGFAERARAEARVGVWVHELDLAVARGGAQPPNEGKSGPYLRHFEAWRTLFGLMFTGGLKVIPILEASTFAEGAVLEMPGRPTVIHLPGHTPGSCALLLEDKEALFTGDSMVMRNPLTGRRGPQIMPSAFNQSSRTALASLSKLEPLAAKLVLSGHGEPWTQGVAVAVHQATAAGPS